MSQSNNNQGVKKFYVYGHYTLEGNLFYIGVGTVLNLQTQKITLKYSRAYHFINRTQYWYNIKNKHGLKVKILSDYYTKEESLVEEQRLIALYKRRSEGGILCNLSSGGEIGPIGHKKPMSEKQKTLLSRIKSTTLYVYDSQGTFIKDILTIEETAKFCGVTYNAIHSCMQTKNYSNGYFIFRSYQGLNLGYTATELNFKSTLSKRVVTEDLVYGLVLVHDSIWDCTQYLKTDRKNLKNAINAQRVCKKHKVYFEGAISSQDSYY